MNTNFFTEITNALNSGQINLTLTFSKADNFLSVSLLPIDSELNDDCVKNLKPLSLSGTPSEIDDEFFTLALIPIKETLSFFSNQKEYLVQKKIATDASQKEKDLKEKIKKTSKELKDLMDKTEELETNNSKIKKLILSLKELEPANSYAEECTQILLSTTNDNKLF